MSEILDPMKCPCLTWASKVGEPWGSVHHRHCDGTGHRKAVTARPDDGCQADRDGDCSWSGCPQLRDGEPLKSHRHCPLDVRSDESTLAGDELRNMTHRQFEEKYLGYDTRSARPDKPKGDKGNENAAVNNYAHKHYNDSSRMLGYVDGYKDAANEYNRQLQAERKRREDERKRMCRELIAIRRDESRHVAGNYYENWTAGRWRAVNEWIAKEFASELAQDSSRTGDPGADLSADHPESSE